MASVACLPVRRSQYSISFTPPSYAALSPAVTGGTKARSTRGPRGVVGKVSLGRSRGGPAEEVGLRKLLARGAIELGVIQKFDPLLVPVTEHSVVVPVR